MHWLFYPYTCLYLFIYLFLSSSLSAVVDRNCHAHTFITHPLPRTSTHAHTHPAGSSDVKLCSDDSDATGKQKWPQVMVCFSTLSVWQQPLYSTAQMLSNLSSYWFTRMTHRYLNTFHPTRLLLQFLAYLNFVFLHTNWVNQLELSFVSFFHTTDAKPQSL